MKKNMMRILLAAMLVLNLAACGGGGVKTTCELCGEKDKMCTEETLWGEKMYVCKDCKELFGLK